MKYVYLENVGEEKIYTVQVWRTLNREKRIQTVENKIEPGKCPFYRFEINVGGGEYIEKMQE